MVWFPSLTSEMRAPCSYTTVLNLTQHNEKQPLGYLLYAVSQTRSSLFGLRGLSIEMFLPGAAHMKQCQSLGPYEHPWRQNEAIANIYRGVHDRTNSSEK